MTAPDKIVEVGAPAMWISGEDGFTMTTQASIDSDGPQHSLVRAIREATLNHGPLPPLFPTHTCSRPRRPCSCALQEPPPGLHDAGVRGGLRFDGVATAALAAAASSAVATAPLAAAPVAAAAVAAAVASAA